MISGSANSEMDGEITLIGKDSDALLELMDAGKNILKKGHGKIKSKLKKGMYYARIKNAQFQYEQPVALFEGENVKVDLDFHETSDSLEDNQQLTEMDRFLNFSYSKVPKYPNNTTAVVEASRIQEHMSLDNNLSRLGKLTATGLNLIISNESYKSNSLGMPIAYIWSQKSKPVKKKLILRKVEKGIGQSITKLNSDHYWLSLKSKKQLPVFFSIVIPRESTAYFILHIEKNGKSRIFQYLPVLKPRTYGVTDKDEISAIRRHNVVQKYYQTDIQNYFYKDLLNLAYQKWYDPMAGLISGNIMLRNRKNKKSSMLRNISHNMADKFPEISDSHVIAGRYYDLNGKSRSKEYFHAALEKGIPIFTENLEALYNAIKDSDFEDMEAISSNVKMVKKVYKKRIRSSIWTCYSN